MAARHVERAAVLASRHAVLLGFQQQLTRALPVASLLSLESLVTVRASSTGCCKGASCQASSIAPAAAAAQLGWHRSFASSAVLHIQQPGGTLGTSSNSPVGAGETSRAATAPGYSSSTDGRSTAGRNPNQQQQQQLRAAHSAALPAEEPPLRAQQQQQQQQQPQPVRTSFKVEAAYVGSKINIYDLMNRPEFSGHYKKLHKGTVVLGLTHRAVDPQCEITGMPLDPYMVAFSYGSVVFFNSDRELKEAYLQVCRDEAADPVSADRPYTEEYPVTVDPREPLWSRLEADNVILQVLDLRNIQVISQVLAQSVAMDFYSSHVERTLETFCNMNLVMQETKNIAKINKQVLLQMVAENNIVMTDIINKLGVHERYDIAWKHVQYGRIWEFLRSELEMDARFKTLDMKLNLIQDNLKYFLEILQNRKSDFLEWFIIVLIGAEICLSLYDLFSKGM
ncbi:hypothetical protein N2152v2_004388 [Parachlorella kessleri]